MKQLLFLLLFPCLAMAQYQGNAGQKITLGEQTSADGLVWRGRTSDTSNLMTNKLDTSAYLVLDTITEAIWLYRASTTPKWNRVVDSLNNLQGQLSLTTKVTDVLPVANGGTGSATQNFVDLTTAQTVEGQKTFNSNIKFKDNSNGFLIAQGTGGNSTYSGFWHNSVDFNQSKYSLLTNGSTLLLNTQTTITLAINDSGKFSARSFGADVIGSFGIGNNPPTARLHIAEGTATAGKAPLKFTSGTNLTTPEAGAVEFNGTNLLFTPSTTRHTVNHGLTGSATLEFESTNAQNSRDMTITVTGAAVGDVVSLGVPNAAVNANTCYTAWVSAANTVTVRFNNYSSGTVDPASGLFKVFVTK